MEKQRCYYVIDMKSFFASVECAERGLDPETTNLVVADLRRGKNTVCLAVSPSMKKLGIKNRCRLFEIPKEIEYITAIPRMNKYISYAAEIYSIYLNYFSKDDIHVYSIDECFIDVTDYLKLYKYRAVDFAKKLMKEIYEKLHIPSTCGIGTNLFLAKIALDITAKKNPNKIGYLTEEKFKKELWYHEPLSDFWGISYGTISRLAKFKIKNMHDIATYNEDALYKEFGINAELLIDHSNGIETCLMSDIKNYTSKSRSISNSQILPFNYNINDATIVFEEMLQEGCYRLIYENQLATNLSILVGYGNEKRQSSKGSIKFTSVTNLYSQILPQALSLFKKTVDPALPIRRITYSFNNLVPDKFEQLDFFTDYKKVQKEKKLSNSIIEIKKHFGKNAILKALDFEHNATQIERNTQVGGHNSD